MQLPSTLTDEQSRALIAVLRLFAAHGRTLRLAREREQKARDAETMGIGAASLAGHNGGTLLPKDTTDAGTV